MWPFTRRDADFEREIEAHLALEVDQLIADGVPPDEARTTARRTFGNATAHRERFYESRRILWWDQLRQDARIALRSSLRDRGVVLVALLSLAIGIGATTAIVSMVDAVLLRPLPYNDPDRLVMIWEEMAAFGFRQNTPAPGNYFAWAERSRSFEGMAATVATRGNLTGDGPPERVLGRRVTPNFFEVLGVRPQLGRTFTEEEDRQNAPVAVISHSLWQRRYAGDPAIVGRQIRFNDLPTTVLGVMPASFTFRDREMEYWVPTAMGPALRTLRTAHILNVVGRLKDGVTLDAARAEMRTVAAELEREYQENADVGVVMVPLREDVYGDSRQQLIVLSVAAACLLLLMSANLANLLIARAVAKRRELATRAALGAGRLRLVAQMVSEGVIWSVLGGVLGVAVAVGGLEVLRALVPTSLAADITPQLDGRLLLVALALSLLTGVGFSLVPALRASRVDPNDVLKSTSGGVGGSWRTRSVLITVQIAASVALLVGAGLMVQSLLNVRAIGLGFRPDGLLTANTALPPGRYDEQRRTRFYEQVVEQLRATPGVVSAGFSSTLPFLSRGNTAGYAVDERAEPEPGDALFRVVTPDYLRTLGVMLLAGRLPDARDTADSPAVVVVNKTFAELHWPGTSALGHRVQSSGDAGWMTIVGVIADIRENGYEVSPKSGIYVLASQVGFPADNLVVRASLDSVSLAGAMRRAVANADPEQPVAAVRTMEEIIGLDVVDRRQQSIVLAAFALTALLLASAGIYGLVSFSVTMRRREVGLRTALGASASEVTRALVKHGMVLVGAGLAIGLVASLAGTRIMEGLLYGIEPRDPLTFGAIGALVFTTTVVACWLPAWRAARMSPMAALRQE